MKKANLLLIAVILFFSHSYVASGQVNIINQIGDKKQATFGDAVFLYIITLGVIPSSFDVNVNILKNKNILPKKNYKQDKPLRKGTLALMIAKHLKLEDSLMYLIFKFPRYAHRACIAYGLMPVDGSEWDILTGEELLEIIALVEEEMEYRQ